MCAQVFSNHIRLSSVYIATLYGLHPLKCRIFYCEPHGVKGAVHAQQTLQSLQPS